ncbi:MAG: ABC transporter permease [Ignavibacteria bacterium]|nr:ABC transporter permease [Ignavibacteria bacterium]MBI3765784.1 ABC transporter permease [Ignavibacteriales bacterium]
MKFFWGHPASSRSHIGYLAGVLLLVVLMTWWKWGMLSMCILSLVLSLLSLVTTHFDMSGTLLIELVPYWLSCGTWVFIIVFLVNKIRKGYAHRGRESVPVVFGRQFPKGSRVKRVPLSVILVCVIVALEAPLLAPFDPLSQGDLRSTRFLNPFEKALVTETTLSVESGGRFSNNWIEQSLHNANNYLLQHNENYTRWNSLIAGDGSSHVRTFLLGTDGLGRDVLSRLIYALRISLLIGFAGMLGSILFGCVVGFIAGISGGWVDHLLMRITDLFLAIPSLFLVIVLVAFLGNSLLLLILVLAGTGWMSVARLVRSELLSLREREFILAARLLGRSRLQIVREHMVPNVVPIIIVALVLQFGNVILAEAALSFLGLGIQPPTPTLGNMIGESYQTISTAWWASIFPGVVLSLIIVSFSGIAESLRREVQFLR